MRPVNLFIANFLRQTRDCATVHPVRDIAATVRRIGEELYFLRHRTKVENYSSYHVTR